MNLLDSQLKEVVAGPFGRLSVRQQVWLLVYSVSQNTLPNCIFCTIQEHILSLLRGNLPIQHSTYPCGQPHPKARPAPARQPPLTPKITSQQDYIPRD